jgi:hypothetical protein
MQADVCMPQAHPPEAQHSVMATHSCPPASLDALHLPTTTAETPAQACMQAPVPTPARFDIKFDITQGCANFSCSRKDLSTDVQPLTVLQATG